MRATKRHAQIALGPTWTSCLTQATQHISQDSPGLMLGLAKQDAFTSRRCSISRADLQSACASIEACVAVSGAAASAVLLPWYGDEQMDTEAPRAVGSSIPLAPGMPARPTSCSAYELRRSALLIAAREPSCRCGRQNRSRTYTDEAVSARARSTGWYAWRRCQGGSCHAAGAEMHRRRVWSGPKRVLEKEKEGAAPCESVWLWRIGKKYDTKRCPEVS